MIIKGICWPLTSLAAVLNFKFACFFDWSLLWPVLIFCNNIPLIKDKIHVFTEIKKIAKPFISLATRFFDRYPTFSNPFTSLASQKSAYSFSYSNIKKHEIKEKYIYILFLSLWYQWQSTYENSWIFKL